MIRHFDLRHEEQGAASTMHISGELDIAAAPHFRQMLGDVMGTGVRDVRVDLSGTDFVDSSGLGALLWAEHRLRAVGGTLELVNAQENVARTFALAGLHGMLH